MIREIVVTVTKRAPQEARSNMIHQRTMGNHRPLVLPEQFPNGVALHCRLPGSGEANEAISNSRFGRV